MAGTAKPVMIASRLLTAALGNLGTGADDEDITNYDKTLSFVVVAQIDEEKGAWNAGYTLYWRNVTDAGAMAPLASTGECKWASDTSLVNGDPVTTKKCAASGGSGSTWQNGEQVEGAATSDAINLADEYYTEVWFAVSCASGLGAKQYEFQLFETNGNTLLAAACAAQITLQADAPTIFVPIIMTTGFPMGA